MRPRSTLLLLAGAVAALGSLDGCVAPAGPSDHGPVHAPAHWGYDGDVGPTHWAGLSPDFELCASGKGQSPIDIVRPLGADLPNPVFAYRPSAIEIVNNGHTVQVNVDPGSALALDGKSYALAQFHFHAPSEHRVGGAAFPVEMHLVHKAKDGELAVVAVFLKPGRGNAAYAPVLSQLPAGPGPARRAPGTVNAADLIPRVHTSFRYGGSLTTPPCSEKVRWTVLTTPVEISRAQIEAFTARYAHNNRPVQPVNSRDVVEDRTP